MCFFPCNGVMASLCTLLHIGSWTFAFLDAAYPRFKTKHRSKKSFRIPQKGKVDVEDSRIYVQGIGWVEAVIHRKPAGRLRNITVTVDPSGSAYASCLFDDSLEAPVHELSEKPKVIGIDLNLERLAVCSDGTEYGNPHALKQHEKKLKHKQKLLSKKCKDSKNWKKLKHEIAVLHEKIADIRKDSIHKMTKKIVCDSQADVIVIEDLNVSGMMRNHKLSKHVQDASFYEVRRQIEYKCLWYGKTLIIADRFFASSRTCHCGHESGILWPEGPSQGRRRSQASGDAPCGRPCGNAPKKHGIRERGKGPWILHGSL